MAVTQYIGSRYVPLLADPVEWSSQNTYEPLTIVLHEGNSYTSKQAVPKDIAIDNEDFWAITGNYNAQVELYRRETAAAQAAADAAQQAADGAQASADAAQQAADGAQASANDALAKTDLVTVSDNVGNNTLPMTGDGLTIINQSGSVEIDVETAGVRSGHGIGFAVGANGPNNKGIAIGDSNTAIADFVTEGTFSNLRPYSLTIPSSLISGISQTSINFTQNVEAMIKQGDVLIVGATLDRETRHDTQTRFYDRFAQAAWGAVVESVSGSNVTLVTGWREKASTTTPSPSGYSTPVITPETLVFVNPQNGIYSHYDVLTVPADAAAGYKLYHSQTHIYNADDPMYSRGDLIVFHGGPNAFAFGATVSTSDTGTTLEALCTTDGNVKRFLQSGTSDAVANVFPQVTTGGAFRKAIRAIPANTGAINLADYINAFVVNQRPTWAPSIFKVNGGNQLSVNEVDLMANTEYEMQLLGSSTFDIVNTQTKILPVTISSSGTRIDLQPNEFIRVSRVSGTHHGYFKFKYYMATDLLTQGHSTTERDLIIDLVSELWYSAAKVQ